MLSKREPSRLRYASVSTLVHTSNWKLQSNRQELLAVYHDPNILGFNIMGPTTKV